MVKERQTAQDKAPGSAADPAWVQGAAAAPFLTLVSDLGSY